jgi:solute carrier family 25 phosphate transporter 23/24/25/41
MRKKGSNTTRQGWPALTIQDVAEQLSTYHHFDALRKSDVAMKVFTEANPNSPSSMLKLDDWLAYAATKTPFLRRLFDEFDTSGSGSINRHEFRRALLSIRVNASEEQVRAMIKCIDRPTGKNDCVPPNGKVEWSEFRDFMLLANPTARFVDFSLLADEWLQHVDDIVGGGGSIQTSADTGSTTAKLPHVVPAWTSAVAGAIGNAFSRTAIAPLERVRMQMITDPGKYPGVWSCLTTLLKEEGVKGLWRGNSINVMRIAPQGGISFFAKDYFKVKIPELGRQSGMRPESWGNKSTPIEVLVASMASGIVCQTGVYPLDTIRTRMTTTPGLYTGLIDGWKKIQGQEGFKALFKGLGAANAFAVPYYGTQFFTYDMLKEQYSTLGMPPGQKRDIHPLIGIPFGSIAACAACGVAFPFQMAWKRIQVQGIGDRPVRYSGTIQCLSKVIKEEGARGVYAGLTANLIKLAPTGALTFVCVEFVKDVMGWR